MDKESIVDVLTADTDVFFACWDTDNGWQVLTNGNASFPAALFAQKGIEVLLAYLIYAYVPYDNFL